MKHFVAAVALLVLLLAGAASAQEASRTVELKDPSKADPKALVAATAKYGFPSQVLVQ